MGATSCTTINACGSIIETGFAGMSLIWQHPQAVPTKTVQIFYVSDTYPNNPFHPCIAPGFYTPVLVFTNSVEPGFEFCGEGEGPMTLDQVPTISLVIT